MIRRLLDFVYPALCELCNSGLQDGKTLCSPCLDKLPRIHQPSCRKCGEPFDGNLAFKSDETCNLTNQLLA